MSLVSFSFFIFCALLLLCFFTLPKKCQWIVLLIFSIVFYAFAGVGNTIYIIITSFSAWIGALWIENVSKKTKQYLKNNKESITIEEKNLIKKKSKRKKKFILAGILILNFGLLGTFKYANFAIEQLNVLIKLFDEKMTITVFVKDFLNLAKGI